MATNEAAVEGRLELFATVCSDLEVEATSSVRSDIFDDVLKVQEGQLACATDSELTERRTRSLQSDWLELEAAIITADLGLDLLLRPADLAHLSNSLLLAGGRRWGRVFGDSGVHWRLAAPGRLCIGLLRGRFSRLPSFIARRLLRHLRRPAILVHIVHELKSGDQSCQVGMCANDDSLQLVMLFHREVHALFPGSQVLHGVSQCAQRFRDTFHGVFHPRSEGVLVYGRGGGLWLGRVVRGCLM